MATNLHENISLLVMRTVCKGTMVARKQNIFIRDCEEIPACFDHGGALTTSTHSTDVSTPQTV